MPFDREKTPDAVNDDNGRSIDADIDNHVADDNGDKVDDERWISTKSKVSSLPD